MPSLSRLFVVPALALSLALAAPAPVLAGDGGMMIESAVAADKLPKGKMTKPGLYVSAAEAAQVLATREDVLLIDVRTPEETIFVGNPTDADVNIPFGLVDPLRRYNAKKSSYGLVANEDFVPATKAWLEAKNPAAVLVICRSGGRSAKAVNALVTAGVDLPLYTVVDGFEGDKDKDGKRSVNGWKNSGAAWSYKVAPDFLFGVR